MKQIFRIKLFTIATGIILFSTITIGLLTTRYVTEKESALEISLIQSNMRLVNQTLDRIEQRINQEDKGLYDYLPTDSMDDILARINDRKPSSDSIIKQLYIIDFRGNVLYPEEGRAALSRFFQRKVFPQLKLNRISLLSVHHLHTAIDFRYYLFSFLKFQISGDENVYMLVLEYDLDNLDAYFNPFVKDLEKSYHVCIRDYENNVIYGQPFQISRKYFVEQRFPMTFYRWLFQLSPRNVSEIEREELNRRLLNISLVVINLMLILSAWFLVYLNRREEGKLTRQKEEFLRNVSHEMKTPLALIKMFSEILIMGRGRDEPTRQEYLEIIFAETERLTFLINNVMDFANLEKGLQKFCFEPINLEDLIRKHLEVFDYRMRQEKVALHLEPGDDVPPIMGDRNALTLVMLNLLDNAIKYRTDQPLRIRIRLEATDGRVRLRITDNGIGIPLTERPYIFNKFYRGDSLSVRRIRGSGIGLSLVKYLVEAHDGTITVESREGEGSTFTIDLPAQAEEPDGR